MIIFSNYGKKVQYLMKLNPLGAGLILTLLFAECTWRALAALRVQMVIMAILLSVIRRTVEVILPFRQNKPVDVYNDLNSLLAALWTTAVSIKLRVQVSLSRTNSRSVSDIASTKKLDINIITIPGSLFRPTRLVIRKSDAVKMEEEELTSKQRTILEKVHLKTEIIVYSIRCLL